jgi:hypothetical protein
MTPLPDLDLASSKMSLQMVCISALGVFVFLPDFPFFTDVWFLFKNQNAFSDPWATPGVPITASQTFFVMISMSLPQDYAHFNNPCWCNGVRNFWTIDDYVIAKDLIIALLYQSMTGTISAQAADDIMETLGNKNKWGNRCDLEWIMYFRCREKHGQNWQVPPQVVYHYNFVHWYVGQGTRLLW